MEWLGINLNNRNAENWLKRGLFSLATISISLILSSTIAWNIWQYANNLHAQNQLLAQQIRKLEQDISQTEKTIARLKNNSEMKNEKVLQAVEIRHFLQILRQLPLKGGLDFVQISINDQPQIILAGKISSTAFNQLEQYLKQRQYRYQIEHLQSNEMHTLAFNLSLWLPTISEVK